MTSNRQRASRPPPPQELRRRPEDGQSPRVGRTSSLGRRAERPSEGSERKGTSPTTEPSRSKPPPPSSSGGRHAPAARELPQPVRDSTA